MAAEACSKQTSTCSGGPRVSTDNHNRNANVAPFPKQLNPLVKIGYKRATKSLLECKPPESDKVPTRMRALTDVLETRCPPTL